KGRRRHTRDHRRRAKRDPADNPLVILRQEQNDQRADGRRENQKCENVNTSKVHSLNPLHGAACNTPVERAKTIAISSAASASSSIYCCTRPVCRRRNQMPNRAINS